MSKFLFAVAIILCSISMSPAAQVGSVTVTGIPGPTGPAGPTGATGPAGSGGTGNANGTVTIASGTATLGTTAIPASTCAAAVAVTANGVLTTDAIIVSYRSDPTIATGFSPATTGSLVIYPFPTSNFVSFKVCNKTASSVTPSAATLNFKVVR